jgi:hypothetical protein
MRTAVKVAVNVVVESPPGRAEPPAGTVALDVLRRLCIPLGDGRFDQGDAYAHVSSVAASIDDRVGWVIAAGDEEGRESGRRGQESGQAVSAPGAWGGRSTIPRPVPAAPAHASSRGDVGRVSRDGYTIEVGAWKRDVDELRGEAAPGMLGEAIGALDPPATAAEVAWLCRFVAGLGLADDLCCATMGAILVATTRAEVAEGVADGRGG